MCNVTLKKVHLAQYINSPRSVAVKTVIHVSLFVNIRRHVSKSDHTETSTNISKQLLFKSNAFLKLRVTHEV